MAQFTKGRFQARLFGFCWTILEKRQPGFNADKVKEQNWIVTVLQALEYATEKEKAVINQMPDVMKTKDDTSDERDSLIGAVEGKMIIYKDLEPSLLLEDKDIVSSDTENRSNDNNTSSYPYSDSSSAPLSRKAKRIIWGIVIAFFAILIIYNLPICKEYRDYRKVVNCPGHVASIRLCNDYLRKYRTTGRHSGDIMYLKVQRTSYDVPTMAEYLTTYPKHKAFKEVKGRYDDRWQAEIAKYEQRDKSKDDPKAVQYMTAMLNYMRTHYCNEMYVKVSLNLNLKEWKEYDKSIRSQIEDSKAISDGMVSVKSNFTTQNKEELKKILADGLQESMNKIFTPNFIRIRTEYPKSSGAIPTTQFSCTINSQEEKYNGKSFPCIWIHKEVKTNKTLGFLMGIAIQFDAKMTIPNSNLTYSYSEKGAPEDNINNIHDIKEGYLRMSAMCFAQFANKMSQNLGLKEIYFQEAE